MFRFNAQLPAILIVIIEHFTIKHKSSQCRVLPVGAMEVFGRVDWPKTTSNGVAQGADNLNSHFIGQQNHQPPAIMIVIIEDFTTKHVEFRATFLQAC